MNQFSFVPIPALPPHLSVDERIGRRPISLAEMLECTDEPIKPLMVPVLRQPSRKIWLP